MPGLARCALLVSAAAVAAGATAAPVGGAVANTPHVPIARGVDMPVVSLGGFEESPGNYSAFLEIGGRGLDTSVDYGTATEKQLGAAVAASVVPRDQIFVTSKVPCCPPPPEFEKELGPLCDEFANLTVAAQVDRILDEIGVDYIDLLLLHWPCATAEQILAHYLQMQKAVDLRKVRAVGVSNFNVSHLQALELPSVRYPPAVNQCPLSIGMHFDEAIAYSQSHNITYQAYGALGGTTGVPVLSNPTVQAVAKAHGKSPAQVALRWVLQRNATFVTAGTNVDFLREDLDVFDFELSAAEMAALNAV